MSSALCSCWCLVELHSEMGSSWDLHYWGCSFPKGNRRLITPQKHHKNCWPWKHGVICDFQSAFLVLSSCSCFPNHWHKLWAILGSQSLYISDCCKARNFLLHAAVWELQCVTLDGFPSPLIVTHEQPKVCCGTAHQTNPSAVPSIPLSGDWEEVLHNLVFLPDISF